MAAPAQIPPGISQPLPVPAPSRVPIYVAGLALVVIAAGLMFIVGVRQGAQRIEERPIAIASSTVARTTPQVVETPTKIVAPTKMPIREQKERHPEKRDAIASNEPSISEPSILGNLDPANAKEVMGSLSPKVRSCFARASGLKWVTLRVIVLPDGKSKAVRVTPNDGDAKRFLECIETAVLAKSFTPFEGNFSTITAEITR
jgi:hypothetical protein